MYLPLPSLYHDYFRRDLPVARTSTPLAHRIITDKPSAVIPPGQSNHRPSTWFSGTDTPPRPSFAYGSDAGMPQAPSSAPEQATVLAAPAPRKRAASILPPPTASRQKRAASSSSSKSGSSAGSVQFCLCKPEPKIPRPSNCFILFRRHHQAAVAAQNPRLPNPEISKIIGQKWKALSDEWKEHWQKYAQDEKIRHQQQYPNYQYKPRRAKQKGGVKVLNGDDMNYYPPSPSLCERCGGRTMSPPSVPSANLGMDDQNEPTMLSRDEENKISRMDASFNMNWHPAKRHHFLDNNTPPVSPGFKRRRFNGDGSHTPVSKAESRLSFPGSPLPAIDGVSPRSSFMIGPAPAPSRTGFIQPLNHDPSLTLPPLQITSQRRSIHEANEDTGATSFIHKIKALSNISPPLSSNYGKHNLTSGDGMVVAVEGQDQESVKCVLNYLQDNLPVPGEMEVKTFEGPEPNSTLPSTPPDGLRDTTQNYMATMAAWHKISNSIVSFIHGSLSPGLIPEANYEDEKPGNSPRSPAIKTEESNIDSSAQPPVADTASNSTPTSPKPSPTTSSCRVALVPRYQLTTADAHASATPIGDSYAPTDHWQWMASLWRGCVGPNITIYIHECDQAELDNYGKGNPVENRLTDDRTLVVRRLAGASGVIEQKVLRRVKFEVEELLQR